MKLSQWWQKFKQTSPSYRMAALQGITALLLITLFMFRIANVIKLYNTDPTSFIISSPEQLRDLSYSLNIIAFFSIGFICASFFLIAMNIFCISGTMKRVRLLEAVIEKDPLLSAIYDQILDEQKKKSKGRKTKDEQSSTS